MLGRKQQFAFADRINDRLIVAVLQEHSISKEGDSFQVEHSFEYYQKEFPEQDIEDISPQSLDELDDRTSAEDIDVLKRVEQSFKDICDEEVPLDEAIFYEQADGEHQKRLYRELTDIERGDIDIDIGF